MVTLHSMEQGAAMQRYVGVHAAPVFTRFSAAKSWDDLTRSGSGQSFTLSVDARERSDLAGREIVQ